MAVSPVRRLIGAVRVRRQRSQADDGGQSGHKAEVGKILGSGSQQATWPYRDLVYDGTDGTDGTDIPALGKPPQRVAGFPARETTACASCLFDITWAKAGVWHLAWGGSHFNPCHCEGSPDGHAPRCPDCGAAMETESAATTCTADPSHHCHIGDGTVEGCGGCFYDPPQDSPGPGERELAAGKAAADQAYTTPASPDTSRSGADS